MINLIDSLIGAAGAIIAAVIISRASSSRRSEPSGTGDEATSEHQEQAARAEQPGSRP